MVGSNSLIEIFSSKQVDVDSSIYDDRVEVTFSIKVVPGANKNELSIAPPHLRIATTAQAIDGKANKSIRYILAKCFGVSKSSVLILKGEKSKIKTVQISFGFTVHKNVQYYLSKIAKGPFAF